LRVSEERKYFFFEKKKQKTFALQDAAADMIGTYRSEQKFLVLFFKKELLSLRLPRS
jgi:hypothetical protein